LQQLYRASTPAARRASPATAGGAAAVYRNAGEALIAVTCTDTNNPRDPFRWHAVARQRDRRFGPFGSFWAYLSQPCATWPARDHDRYTGPFNHQTSAPILIVGTRFDPATPYANARAAARQLPNSRLLTLNGWGHPALPKSTCIATHIDRYLVTGTLPPPGTTCQPDQQPFR
jgi:pimeloyl-ACP methyl ester carboxylesterase